MASNIINYAASNTATATLLNSGTIKVYTGTQPAQDGSLTGTLLATMTFGSTAFAGASGGSNTANTITSGIAGNSGTAGYFALVESGGTVVGTGSVGTSGADLNFSTLTVTSGDPVSCSSFSLTY